MKVGLIGAGNMARRWRAAGASPCCATDSGAGAPRRWPRSSAARRWPPTASWPSGPTSSSSAHKPAQLEAVAARDRRARARRSSRSSARHDAGRPARRLPRHAGVPRCMPNNAVEVRPGRSLRRGRSRRRRRALEPQVARAVRPRRHGRRRAGGADRRRHGAARASAPPTGALVVEAWIDAGDPPRHAARRPRRGSWSRRWPAPPRCCAPATHDTLAAAPRGHLAGRVDRARAARAGARRRARRVRTTRWTPSLEARRDDRPRGDARGHRRLRRRAVPRLHADHHRLRRHVAGLLARRAACPTRAASNAVLDFLRDVSEPYLRIFRRFIPQVGPLDLSPMVAHASCCRSCGGHHRQPRSDG